MQISNNVNGNMAASGADAAGGAGKDALHLSPVSDAEFRDIMARHDTHGGGAVPATAAAVPGAGHGSLGERVMQRASALSGELQKDQQFISRNLEQAARSGDSMQLMKATLALSDYQTRVQFVSKAAAKAASALDQLTKLQ
ncbi:EscI/YscI/HrpB family type III secretion system inner rod protein [Massilia mucilaginosa]|nr:EscI/YscI/HrpB family type III secretion system inner rod protein [Massilia mucilaginosa]